VCEIGLKHAQPGRGAKNRGPGPKQGPCHGALLPGDPCIATWPRAAPIGHPRMPYVALQHGPRRTHLGNRVTGPAGPSWPAGKRPSWPRAMSPLVVLCPGPEPDTWRARACITGHGPRPGCELRLAQLGPAHVAGIKKPGHRPGFEWPAGRIYGAAALRSSNSSARSSSISGIHNAAASSRSPVVIASLRSSVK